ncbi:TonB family protein, partial [Accumulibacter sp.]|uniref:energy transducer TonB n=1 Tax=Accumulibacter sp. TaxID=2053492 RepID=UPI0028C40D27
MSGQAHAVSTYFELPGEHRQPVWRLALCVLVVLGVHLLGLFLAFGTVGRSAPAEALPVLTVRVLELVARRPEVAKPQVVELPPKVDPTPRVERPEKKIRRAKPSRASAVPVEKASPTPPPILAATATAPATTAFTVEPQPAAGPADSPAVPAPVVVAARFDVDYLRNPPPVYPESSRRLGEEGRVLLRIRVSAQGLPTSVEIKQSSGFRRLDEAA